MTDKASGRDVQSEIISTVPMIDVFSAVEKDWRECAAERKIPILKGTLSGTGHVIIDSDSSESPTEEESRVGAFKVLDDLDDKRGAIAVIETIHDDDLVERGISDITISELRLYVRLGAGSLWARTTVENIHAIVHRLRVLRGEIVENEDDDYDDEGAYEEAYEARQQQLELLKQKCALEVAEHPNYVHHGNKNERMILVREVLSKHGAPDLYVGDVWDVVDRAQMLFNQGVLPVQVQTAQRDGKSITEIARELGVSKARAEKAAAIVGADKFLVEARSKATA
ncbi:hypothetical protein LGM46_29665 [Burkholderia arboris]|uniref:hypothetical protein n=1 Tax=Burkholderia arboris TaxID=488730 RepID=UPI001CF2B9D7|nr:hypothetical protein [Burkholderia arboris]MCA8037139.1 hypothetical protein [Burkholderia arboris]